MLMQIFTLILLLILVDFKIHGNINISLDANLGARSSLFVSNTANWNCDTGMSRKASICTSMDASSTNAMQLTKYNYNHKLSVQYSDLYKH